MVAVVLCFACFLKLNILGSVGRRFLTFLKLRLTILIVFFYGTFLNNVFGSSRSGEYKPMF